MVSSDEYDEEGSISGDSANMIVTTRTYMPLQTDMADIKSSANAAVDRMQGPVEIAAGKMVVGNKSAVRKEKKHSDILARLKAVEHRLVRLDVIDGEMENLRPEFQSMRMGFLERIKKTAIRNKDLREKLVGPYDDDVINTRNYHAHCGNAIQDLQLYRDGIRDDGDGALYAYVYGISTSEVLNYKGVPEITQVLSWRGEILGRNKRLPESFVRPFSRFITLARESQSLETDIHQEPMKSLFEQLRGVYSVYDMRKRTDRRSTPSPTQLFGQMPVTLFGRLSSFKKKHKNPTARITG